MQTSSRFSLNVADIEHIGRHFLYAALAGGIGWVLTSYIPSLGVDGHAAVWMPVIVTALTTLQSWAKEHQ